MKLTKKDICAFDECSILHLCKIIVPKYYRIFCHNKERIYHSNFEGLSFLIGKIKELNTFPFMFNPCSGLDNNLLTALNDILEYNCLDPNKIKMGGALKQEIIDQMKEFIFSLEKEFKIIEKSENFAEILIFFKNNERKLKRIKNIPEEDDCKILAGYIQFVSEGNKFLITEDEHFWGYKDLILEYHKINVVEERECHKLI